MPVDSGWVRAQALRVPPVFLLALMVFAASMRLLSTATMPAYRMRIMYGSRYITVPTSTPPCV